MATSLPLSTATKPDALRVGPFEIRPREWVVLVGKHHLYLTRREFQVLYALALRAGHVIQREELLEAIWGAQAASLGDRSVDVRIVTLRRKLNAAAPRWRCIHTHVGVGYRFQPEPVTRHSERQS